MKFRSLAADDIFISYSRSDATTYANGLADELTKLGFSCFTDRLGTDADEGLPQMLLEKVRGSTMLVLLLTRAAKDSPFVEQEVAEFAKSKGTTRMIVPIIFDQQASKPTWQQLIVGIAPELEDETALKTGNPSRTAVSRIEKCFNYSRSKDRLRRYTVGAAILLLFLILAGLGAAVFAGIELRRANAARQDAINAVNERDNAKAEADEQTRRADEEGRRAQRADESTKAAELKRKDAEDRQRAAEDQAHSAQQLADEARLAAKQQQQIADSLQKANDAESKRGKTLPSLVESIDLGKQSLQLSWSLEGDRALRRSLALMPRPPEIKTIKSSAGDSGVTYSPDRTYLARSFPDKTIQIQDTGTGERLAGFSCPNNANCTIAISNEAKYVGSEINGRIQVWERDRDQYKELATCPSNEKESSGELVLSPDGRFLVAVREDGEDSFEAMWRMSKDRKKCESVPLQGMNEGATAVTFSTDGKYLAMAGQRSKLAFTKLNRVVVWELQNDEEDNSPPANPNCPETAKGPFETAVYLNLDSENRIERIAVGVDPKFPVRRVHLAIADGDTISVWRETEEATFLEMARIPAVKDLSALTFSRDLKTLSVIDEKAAKAETWDTSGFRAVAQFVHSSRVGGVAFTPDGSHIATSIGAFETVPQDGLRLLRLKDQTEDVWKPDDLRAGRAISLSPDGKKFSSSVDTEQNGRETAVRIWSWEQRSVSTTQPFRGELEAIAISSSGKWLAVEEVITKEEKESRTLRFGRLVGNHFETLQTKPVDYQVTHLAFSLDGDFLAVATDAGVRVLRSSGLREIADFKLSGAVAIALSPAGEYLAVATGTRTTILNVSTERALSVVEDDHPVNAIGFAKDKRFVATASGPINAPNIPLPDDHVVRVWLFAPHELSDEADRRLSKLR